MVCRGAKLTLAPVSYTHLDVYKRQMKTGAFAELLEKYSITDMFVGNIPGSMGEVSALALLIGGIYLVWRKVINWQTPVAYIATVAVLAFLFPTSGTGVERCV